MDPDTSWINPNYRTELILRYNQLIFDIVEVSRRELARTMMDLPLEPESALAEAKTHLDNTLFTLRTTTSEGTDSSAIARWEQTVRKWLDTMEVDPKPCFTHGDFSVNAFLHLSSHFPMGETSSYFDNGLGVVFGYDLGYKRFSLINNIGLNDSKTLGYLYGYTSDGKPFVAEPGQSATFGNFLFALGYRAVDKDVHTLTPHVGLSFGTVSFLHDKETISGRCRGVAFGLNYRLLFMGGILGAGDGGIITNSAEMLRGTFDLSFLMRYNKFDHTDGSLDGWSALFSVGFAFGVCTLK